MASLTVNYTIPFGSSIRIGYKILASIGPFTYLNFYPTYNQSPFIISGLPLGTYQVELTTVCANCGGGIFSDPVVVNAAGV